MTFRSLDLIDPLLRTLDTLGYETPTPVQKQAIPAVLAGRDLMAAAQTGTGKTAGFALPLLQRLTLAGAVAPHGVRCLVLVPTRELAEQVYDSFRRYGAGVPLRSFVAYGGVPIEPQVNKLRKGLDVLVATPGRLLDLHRQGALVFDQLETLVLDEADRMLDLGFAPELDAVLAAVPAARQTLLFSATFSETIRALAGKLLRDPLSIQASPANAAARTVRQLIYTTDKKSKPELLVHLARQQDWGQVLVFVKTKKGVDALVAMLQDQGFSAEAIHGDRPQPARLAALNRFKAQQVQMLVATDVAARGLDIQALPLVVNMDLPTVAEDYVHRIGRTGRAGSSGQAISLVAADEVDLLRAIETVIRQVLPRVEEPGFEASHRVPSTGAAPVVKTAAKPARAAIKPAAKAAAKAKLGTRPARPERQAAPAPQAGHAPRPAGGFEQAPMMAAEPERRPRKPKAAPAAPARKAQAAPKTYGPTPGSKRPAGKGRPPR